MTETERPTVTVYSATWNNVDGNTLHGPGRLLLAEMINTQLVTAEQLVGLKVGGSRTVPAADKSNKGWTAVTIDATESVTYTCNCCQTQRPGDGLYDICHHCGWENEPGAS